MKKTILVLAAVLAASALTAPGSASAADSRCRTVKVTAKKVGVRKPPASRTSARMSDPVVRWVYRGDRLRSCVMTFNRGSETYRACGKTGQDWYVVRGGQIPKTCARVV